MKLRRLSIRGFKSVINTQDIVINQMITILIGANDHGKTNILQAIEHLNDDSPIIPDEKNWDLGDDIHPRIEWHFSIDEETTSKLSEIQSLPKKIKKIQKAPIENDNDGTDADVDSNEESLSGDASLDEEVEMLEIEDVIHESIPVSIEDSGIEEEENFETNTESKIIYYREGVGNPVKVLSLPIEIPIFREDELLKLRPKVEAYYSIPGTALIDEVNRAQLDTPEYEFIKGIFHLAGLWRNRDQIFQHNDTTSKILDEASERLTEVLNDKWNQGKNLIWKLKHKGAGKDHIVIEIKDEAIKNRYSRPSHRSAGFRTFFLFSMMINSRTHGKENEKYIFLFDEPGTYLHPRAQLDFQRGMESIADETQIVYSTHSMFLISKNYPERNRVVSKTKEGTKVDQKPFVNNWKSVRDSLGILMSNNFLIADKSLLVEGPSDTLYILNSIKRLKANNQIDIDLNDLSIVDAGNSVNYIAMAKLMLSEGRSVVALVDGDESGRNVIKKLKKVCTQEIKNNMLQILQLPDNKSIEDLFTEADYLKEAIVQLAGELVDFGVRKLAEGIKMGNIKDKLKLNKNKKETLGTQINNTTKVLFDPEEKLSKLSLALAYDDIVKGKKIKISKEASKLILDMKNYLDLKGEKSKAAGVFEEIAE